MKKQPNKAEESKISRHRVKPKKVRLRLGEILGENPKADPEQRLEDIRANKTTSRYALAQEMNIWSGALTPLFREDANPTLAVLEKLAFALDSLRQQGKLKGKWKTRKDTITIPDLIEEKK